MGKQWKQNKVTDFIFLGSKITVDSNSSHEIKRRLLLERIAMKKIDSILKSRDVTLPTKICLVKTMFFSSKSHVRIWEMDHKESCVPKNWYFQNCGVEDSWEEPQKKSSQESLDCKEITPVHLKEINSPYSLEGLMLTLKLQYFGHLIWRADSLKKTLMLGKMEARRRNGQQRTRWVDGITNSKLVSLSTIWKMVKDGEAWSSAVCGAANSWTWLISQTTTTATVRFFLAFLLPLFVKPLQLYLMENAVGKGRPLYLLHLYKYLFICIRL